MTNCFLKTLQKSSDPCGGELKNIICNAKQCARAFKIKASELWVANRGRRVSQRQRQPVSASERWLVWGGLELVLSNSFPSSGFVHFPSYGVNSCRSNFGVPKAEVITKTDTEKSLPIVSLHQPYMQEIFLAWIDVSKAPCPLYRQSMSMNISFSSPMQPCQMISREDKDQCQETWKHWEEILMSSSLKLSRLDGHSFLHLICAPGKYVIFITCRQSSPWLIMCCSLNCYFILKFVADSNLALEEGPTIHLPVFSHLTKTCNPFQQIWISTVVLHDHHKSGKTVAAGFTKPGRGVLLKWCFSR